MSITIRRSTPADAGAIEGLVKEFKAYLESLGDQSDFNFSAETYLRDGFGEAPAFSGLVAEAESEVMGYLLYHFGYETDLSRRLVYVIDLYVRRDQRRSGIGEALMRACAEIGKAHGAQSMVWSVFKPNTLAVSFYERLGARCLAEVHYMSVQIGELLAIPVLVPTEIAYSE